MFWKNKNDIQQGQAQDSTLGRVAKQMQMRKQLIRGQLSRKAPRCYCDKANMNLQYHAVAKESNIILGFLNKM